MRRIAGAGAFCQNAAMAQRPVARIHIPPKSAMQSGRAKSQGWVLEFMRTEKLRVDPLMGWVGSGDTQSQVQLRFGTREQAVAYAEANGFDYTVEEPKPHQMKPKAYAENFRFGRCENWTH
jgi:hypothetical protein